MRVSLRPDWHRRLLSVIALLALLGVHSGGHAEKLPIVEDVEFQPLPAQVKRVVEALEMLGQPLDRDEKPGSGTGARSVGGRRRSAHPECP